MQDAIVIGKFGSVHGVHGWLKIRSFTVPAENIVAYQPWYLQIKGKWQLVEDIDFQKKGNLLLAKLPNVEAREQAKLYTNIEIGVDRSRLPELSADEYYWSDLEGLTVINQDGVNLGTVDHLFDSGANDVLVVQAEDRQRLIPYILDAYILAIDLAAKQIQVNWDPDF